VAGWKYINMLERYCDDEESRFYGTGLRRRRRRRRRRRERGRERVHVI